MQLEYNRLDPLITGDSTDPARDPLQPAPDRRSPCSGPGCSSHVPLPVPTGAPESDRLDRWCSLSAPALLPIAATLRRVIDDPTAHSTGQKPSIFHPPPA
jgi:hypothetical protein